MALNIKDERTDRVARELARETGEPITTATRIALEERLARIRAQRTRTASVSELSEIIRRGRRRPLLDHRPDDAILGYDSAGLPG